VLERQAAERLEALSALTNYDLSGLDVDDLLNELLERVRGILDADTAAILLVEDGADHLVARAARGLEEEVRQGVKVPVGVGFAGSIAAHRKPVLLDRVDSTTVSNPILWEKGIRAMLGVPLFNHDRVTGVLHVGRLQPRPFSSGDAEVLQVAGDRVTGALQARQLAVETAAAQMLERGLLPTRLPSVPGLQFASRYVPADSRAIGGDWYDAFVLPSGRLWLVTGDVAGHGLEAAVIMGRVKSALRAYALTEAPVAEVIRLTDRKVLHFEIGSMVTLVAATAEPPYDHFDVCAAGHLPPVIAQSGGVGSLLELPVGPPLGIQADVARQAIRVGLAPGTVLALYTDGLVERRDRTLAERLELLCRHTHADHPEAVCRDIMHEMVGLDDTHDDIALLAVRRTPDS
jgi:sigma-B regulation protein RsbU (phosphoserine phosphatase)